jgi:hypothetical protein
MITKHRWTVSALQQGTTCNYSLLSEPSLMALLSSLVPYSDSLKSWPSDVGIYQPNEKLAKVAYHD